MADIEYLKSLQAVRERARLVLHAAEQDKLTHFSYREDLMPATADFVAGIITRDFGPDKFDQIPPHGRWQHFEVGGIARVEQLIRGWEAQGHGKVEVARRLTDLFFVAVLLDAGAGDTWKFTEPNTSNAYGRSEDKPETVDGRGLMQLSLDTFLPHFQVSPTNPLVGVESRVTLLQNVGSSFLALPKIFGETGRPGHLVDYLLENRGNSERLDFENLWGALQETLLPAWPKNRTHIRGIPIGDAWPLQALARLNPESGAQNETAHIQPFHKLTQWLAYSLSVPMTRILGLEWDNAESGTGLAEYRNGGLFVDMGVLTLKDDVLKAGLERSKQSLPIYDTTGDVIVEWRAMTVALLDKLHELVRAKFSDRGVTLSMAQMLEAGSWKGGRELAAKYRPETRSSPILIEGDGTLF
ncbi:hypothetical protein N7470_005764 [Penicillium chermesinum]|nr:hypothetical protein N7470_005764 [Penicillium chermesinum]